MRLTILWTVCRVDDLSMTTILWAERRLDLDFICPFISLMTAVSFAFNSYPPLRISENCVVNWLVTSYSRLLLFLSTRDRLVWFLYLLSAYWKICRYLVSEDLYFENFLILYWEPLNLHWELFHKSTTFRTSSPLAVTYTHCPSEIRVLRDLAAIEQFLHFP